MKKYQIIYADPPWRYNFSGTRAKPLIDYPTMGKEQICGLNVKDIAENNSMLLMWVTFPLLNWAFDVMQAWGFDYVTNAFTWIKENRTGNGLFWGMGFYTRSNAELCLLGRRGDGVPVKDHSVHSVIMTPIARHSKKPPIIRTHIETLFGEASRIELFARKPELLFDAEGYNGWDVWGNEVDSDIELAGMA